MGCAFHKVIKFLINKKALVTVQYLGIPFEIGYNIEDPVLLMPKK